MKPACQQQMTEHRNQARREILLSVIAVILIISVTVYVAKTDDNHLKHEVQRISCEKMWLASVLATHDSQLRDRLKPITGGRLPSQIAASVACAPFFEPYRE